MSPLKWNLAHTNWFLEEFILKQIIKNHSAILFFDSCVHIDMIKLGAGDGAKTRILLEYLHTKNIPFRYVPVDISAVSNRKLIHDLKATLYSGRSLKSVDTYQKPFEFLR